MKCKLFFLLIVCIAGCDPIDPGIFLQRLESAQLLHKPGPILFLSDESGVSQLYSMQIDGSGIRKLTNIAGHRISDAHWCEENRHGQPIDWFGRRTVDPF